MPDHSQPSSPFERYTFGAPFDEMFDTSGVPRPHYAGIYDRLRTQPIEVWRERQRAADVTFLTQGITFTVQGRAEGAHLALAVGRPCGLPCRCVSGYLAPPDDQNGEPHLGDAAPTRGVFRGGPSGP